MSSAEFKPVATETSEILNLQITAAAAVPMLAASRKYTPHAAQTPQKQEPAPTT